MISLVELVAKYRGAQRLDERLGYAEEIIGTARPKLWAFFSRRCPDAADDLCQETSAAIAKGLHQFHGEADAQFWAWCYQVARNKLSSHLRRQSAAPVVAVDEHTLWETVEKSAAADPISAEDRQELDHAMELLRQAKPPCYDYLWLHFIDGLSYPDIGREIGLSTDGVRMKIKRCLELARSLVAQHP